MRQAPSSWLTHVRVQMLRCASIEPCHRCTGVQWQRPTLAGQGRPEAVQCHECQSASLRPQAPCAHVNDLSTRARVLPIAVKHRRGCMQLARMPNIPNHHPTYPIPSHSEWSGERARCCSRAGGRGCVAPEASLSTGVDALIAAAATPPGPARRAPSSLVLGGRRGGNLAAEGGHGSPPERGLRLRNGREDKRLFW